MYAGVPRTVPSRVVPAAEIVAAAERPGSALSTLFARPKSSTLALPAGVILTLAGLRSR
jgi:hypothetical protein